MTDAIARAIVVAAEITGTELSPTTLGVMVSDLGAYSEEQVLAAIDRCRRELTHRLTLADIISRIDDGRPAVAHHDAAGL